MKHEDLMVKVAQKLAATLTEAFDNETTDGSYDARESAINAATMHMLEGLPTWAYDGIMAVRELNQPIMDSVVWNAKQVFVPDGTIMDAVSAITRRVAGFDPAAAAAIMVLIETEGVGYMLETVYNGQQYFEAKRAKERE